jgi:quercetin dioxygenase-like cupin family protein
MSGLQSFDSDQLDKLAGQAKPYHEFLRRRSMSLGMYVLPVGGTDRQHPHASDEVYIILRGRGTLRVGDQDHEVRQGSILSVDHGEEHRFTDVSDDLHILVVFAPPDDPA